MGGAATTNTAQPSQVASPFNPQDYSGPTQFRDMYGYQPAQGGKGGSGTTQHVPVNFSPTPPAPLAAPPGYMGGGVGSPGGSGGYTGGSTASDFSGGYGPGYTNTDLSAFSAGVGGFGTGSYEGGNANSYGGEARGGGYGGDSGNANTGATGGDGGHRGDN
jgi:hypothetical protein